MNSPVFQCYYAYYMINQKYCHKFLKLSCIKWKKLANISEFFSLDDIYFEAFKFIFSLNIHSLFKAPSRNRKDAHGWITLSI